MALMAAKRRDNGQADWRSDWWLWPMALLLMMGGWGQTLWMGENTSPEGLAPLWLLLWAGGGVAGATLPIHWLGRRWGPVAWAAVAAWAGVPAVHDLARHYNRAAQTGDEGLYGVLALSLLLLLLGLGLSGVMTTVSWLAHRRWPGPAPNIRPLRQGFWAGLFAVICGWLLINRAFTPVPVALLAGALVLIETFFVTRESPRERKT